MVENFKQRLKDKGQSLKWFYLNYIKPDNNIYLTYPGFAGQLNGYSPVSPQVKEQIKKYMEETNG